MQCCVAIRVSSIDVDAVLNKVPEYRVETKHSTRMKHRLSRGKNKRNCSSGTNSRWSRHIDIQQAKKFDRLEIPTGRMSEESTGLCSEEAEGGLR